MAPASAALDGNEVVGGEFLAAIAKPAHGPGIKLAAGLRGMALLVRERPTPVAAKAKLDVSLPQFPRVTGRIFW